MPVEHSTDAVEDRPVRRRVRTGCQRCRIRRRKCDERKPVCSNCADRNFECQYGLQLRFPAGSARTAPPIEAAPRAKYTQIRFADDPHKNTKAGSKAEKENVATANRSPNNSHFKSAEQSSGYHRSQSAADTADGEARQIYLATGSIRPVHDGTYQIPYHAQSQHCNGHFTSTASLEAESAEHGAIQSLVSLANSADHHFVFEEDLLSHSQVLTTSKDGYLHHDSASHIPATSSSSLATRNLAQTPKSPVSSASEDRDVELLRYYRYHVAPWLDMLDLNQHLGLHLPAVGADSPSTIHALHALSARHRELASGVPEIAQFESDRYYNMSRWGGGAMGSMETPDTLEARVIRLLVDLISAPLSSWTRQLEKDGPLIASLYDYAFELGLPASLFWCIFRFDLAAALVNDTFMATNLDMVLSHNPFHGNGLPKSVDKLGPAEDLDPNCVDQYALQILCLCGTAINILQDHRFQDAVDERSSRTKPRGHLARWQRVWSDLSSWYTGRHKFVRPLLELSLPADEEVSQQSSGSSFPTIIFTTAAATLANLVYHTAATAMLECKPKTLKIAGQHSPAASLHWHAQRTCAIAVSNANFQSWDPCMVVCVLQAAQKMTHRDQQAAILATLEQARDATGWGFTDELQRLRQFWRLAEHS